MTFGFSLLLLQLAYYACWCLPSKGNGKENNLLENMDTPDLMDAINSMSAIKTIMEGLLPGNEIKDIVGNVSQLYKLKAELSEKKPSVAFTDHQVVEEILDIAINQSCTWLTDVIKEESFSCSEEEMIWLEIKLNIMNLADTTKTSLKSKTQNSYYDICQWMKENIYCTTGPVGSLKAFIEERQIYLHCKPSSC